MTGAVAVIAAGVGAIFGIMALNDARTFNNDRTSANADTRNLHALIADLALGSALAFGVTSTVLFVTAKDPPPPDNSKKASPDKDDPPKRLSTTGFTSAPLRWSARMLGARP